ncbi:MAG: zinc ribbon domain-containing protein [Ruminiclostridium sp.]|nr:zinc ribbon domain-containing protein [Ruminiclostridium sp.]
MLYCANCGNPVNVGDKFCEKCETRLNADNVKTAEFIAQERHSFDNFEPDSFIVKRDLCGQKIFDYRITHYLGNVSESDFYTAGSAKDGNTNKKTIQHIILPSQESYEVLLRLNEYSKEKADKVVQDCIYSINEEIPSFRLLCSEAGIPCIYEDVKVLFSEFSKVYHVFIIMKPVTPFVHYISEKSVTVRNVIEWGISISDQLSAIARSRNTYSAVDETNMFVDDEGSVYLGSRMRSTFKNNMYLSAYTNLNNLYLPPEDWEAEQDVYGIGMLLYLLLNRMRHPYITQYEDKITGEKYSNAEKQRLSHCKARLPHFAQNSMGRELLRTFSDVDEHIPNISELGNVLRNSLNYITTEELNAVVINVNNQNTETK